MSRLKRLIQEIHRRSLWQVLLIYCGAALVAYQAVQALTEGLALPHWFPALAVVLFIIGLPIVLATAFVHEVAPPKVTPAEPTPLTEAEAARVETEAAAVHLEARRRHRFLTWRNAVATFVIVLAAWGVVATAWLIFADRTEPQEIVAAEGVQKSIAVLPFENIGGVEENEAFTDGIHDDILTHLYKIGDLKPIARTSVLRYRSTTMSVREIAEELGVATVLEGGVQRAGDRVRINVQLIDPETEQHLWAETYDSTLTAQNIFAIQTDIARRIAVALKATLSSEEEERIEARPTDNLEAYEYYLRGSDLFRRPASEQNLRAAASMFEEAIALDPQFAGAHAALSRIYSYLYWLYFDRSDERLALALNAARAALEIDPELPDAHLALAYYYYRGRRDYERALDALHVARGKGLPGSEYYTLVARIKRRQGDFESALAGIRSALEEDPLFSGLLWDEGITHLWSRRHFEAERSYDQALSLAPEPLLHVHKARLYVAWQGNVQRAWESLRALDPTVPLGVLLDRDVSGSWALFRILYADATEAQNVLRANRSQLDSALYYLAYAEAAGRLGRSEEASAHYDSARAVLASVLEERPGDAIFHSELGVAYAGLGRKDEAVGAGERAVRLLPLSRDAVVGTEPLAYLAQIHTVVGDHDSAIGDIEALLEQPGWMTTHWLRLDPIWDPLRDHPLFQTLLQKYE